MTNAGHNGIRIFGVLALPVVLAGFVTGTGRAGMSGAAAAVSCQGTIGRQPPSPGTSGNELAGVAVRSASDVWAVGSASGGGPNQTLTEHWDGSAWTVVPSPSPGVSAGLTSVRALSHGNAWAVGAFSPGDNSGNKTLIEHWDGSSWTVVPSPNPGSGQLLSGLRFVSKDDGWAVGGFEPSSSSGTRAMILHWNGTKWALVRSPEPGSDPILAGVAATAHDDAWAVGTFSEGTGSSTLIEHWDGTTWKKVASPNPEFADALESVGATSATNAWAVGIGADGTSFQTLILHWNGRKWAHVASPNPGGPVANAHVLTGLAAPSANSAWAVGEVTHVDAATAHQPRTAGEIPGVDGFLVGRFRPPAGTSSTFGVRTLVLHWNGTKWTNVTSPNLGSGNNTFLTAVAASTKITWAVGTFSDAGEGRALAIHCR